jgi:uncharacterized phage infection (PIP) family protein YhgE
MKCKKELNDVKNNVTLLKSQLRDAKDKRNNNHTNSRDISPNIQNSNKLIDENKMLNNLIKELNDQNQKLNNEIK